MIRVWDHETVSGEGKPVNTLPHHHLRPYELIDHTADLGLRVFGKDPADLFIQAALALFDQIVDITVANNPKPVAVRAEGADWADLMVNWLRELLYLWNGKELLLEGVGIKSITQKEIFAHAQVVIYKPKAHLIKRDIKAVTYHQTEVKQANGGWVAQVIFDV